jgi:uncharacterized protein YciI
MLEPTLPPAGGRAVWIPFSGNLENTMKQLFAVLRSHGPSWQALKPLEGQEEWEAHASFMNALEGEGFVVLGGPLEGTRDVLLIVRAETSDEVVERLSADPWTRRDLLRVGRVAPWTLRLGSLP